MIMRKKKMARTKQKAEKKQAPVNRSNGDACAP